jgi:mRNA interferase MazF
MPALNRGWPGDVSIGDLASAGLPVASVIRTAKVATIDAGDATKPGRISAAALRQVTQWVGQTAGTGKVGAGR